jgi:hypothetical protein
MRRHIIALICLGLVVFPAGVLVGLWIWDWLEVDRCLDQGGRWDYHMGVCLLK